MDWRGAEAETTADYEELLAQLWRRGLQTAELIVSDGVPAVRSAAQTVYPAARFAPVVYSRLRFRLREGSQSVGYPPMRKRQFPRWSHPDPTCPVHGSSMVLTPMNKPAFIIGVTEDRRRMIWRCAEPNCPRVSWDYERDSQLVPADAPAPSSPTERMREFRKVEAEMMFGDRN